MDKKINEKKKRYAIVITFLVLMICITGGTYAYFALTASNNSVTGSVGGASLNLTVTKVYPTSEHNNKNMIPQLESTLDEAISLEHKCVDGNGNVICQVYSATVTNVGSTTSVLNGTINFTGIENMPNLKWMRINDSNTLGTYSSSIASTDKALFEEERSFGANTSNTYYFVFWIDETGEVQTDNGTFRANIEFNSSEDGLTSTIRPSELAPGIYNEDGTLKYSWQQLIDETFLSVSDGVVSFGYPSVLESEFENKTFILQKGITGIDAGVLRPIFKYIEIPDTVTIINMNAMEGADGSNFILPNSIILIKEGAFHHYSGSVTYDGTIAEWNRITKETDWNPASDGITVHCKDGDVTIPAWQ